MHWHAKKYWSFLPLLDDSAHDTETRRETVKTEKKQNINKLTDWPTVYVRQPAGCVWNINKNKQTNKFQTVTHSKNKQTKPRNKHTAFRFLWLLNEKYKMKTTTTKTFSNQTLFKKKKKRWDQHKNNSDLPSIYHVRPEWDKRRMHSVLEMHSARSSLFKFC